MRNAIVLASVTLGLVLDSRPALSQDPISLERAVIYSALVHVRTLSLKGPTIPPDSVLLLRPGSWSLVEPTARQWQQGLERDARLRVLDPRAECEDSAVKAMNEYPAVKTIAFIARGKCYLRTGRDYYELGPVRITGDTATTTVYAMWRWPEGVLGPGKLFTAESDSLMLVKRPGTWRVVGGTATTIIH